MSDNVTLTFGLRHDEYSGDDTPTNASFLSTYGFKNGGIKGTDLTTYRFGADIVLDDMSDLNITYVLIQLNCQMFGYQMHIPTLELILLITIAHMEIVLQQVCTVTIHSQVLIRNLIV